MVNKVNTDETYSRYIPETLQIFPIFFNNFWLVLSIPLTNIRQNWIVSSTRAENKKYLSCHHLDFFFATLSDFFWGFRGPLPFFVFSDPKKMALGSGAVGVDKVRR